MVDVDEGKGAVEEGDHQCLAVVWEEGSGPKAV